MVSLVQKEIITELKECGEDFENIIAGTYSLKPQFFEEEILKIFQQKDAKRIMLMVDSRHYEETFQAARKAGVMYLIEPISLKHDFHPKFILMSSEETGKLLVGSGNLTENGLIRDGEIFTLVDYDLVKEYPDILSVFAEMKDFLISLSERDFIRSSKHEEQILKSLDVPWLVDAEPSEADHRRIRLLHSVKRAILSQVKEILNDEEVTRIILTSPFFDLKGKVLRYLVDDFCDTIHLLIQPDRVHNFPIKTIKKLRREGSCISTYKIAFRNDINRFIHAKIAVFETEKGSYCLTGSANATSAGLLSTSRTGNVELCLLRYEKKRKSFDYVLMNNELESKQVNLSLLKSNPLSPPITAPSPDIYIEEAKLESNKLIIYFSPPVGKVYKHATLTVSRPVSVKPITMKQTLSDKGRLMINLSEDTKRFCEQSAFVTLTLRKGLSKKTLSSNKRWISTEVLEQTPRKRDVNIVEKTNGRIGLIRLMNQLNRASEIPTMLLYYLQFLDFDWLAESLDRHRRRIVRRSLGEEGSEDEMATFERYVLTAEEVLEKIVDRHEKKFEQMIEEIELNEEDLQIRVRRMFDLFLFINKIVIWFILRKDVGMEELSDMIHRMKLLVGTRERFWYKYEGLGYLDRVKEFVGKKTFLDLYEKLDVLPHFIVLSKIILNLSKGMSRRLRLELTNQLGDAIRNACIKKNKSKEIAGLSKESLMKVVEEYDEYEHFFFSYKTLLNHTLKIIKGSEPRGHCNECKRVTSFRINSNTYLCPNCARKRFGKRPTHLILMECRKCCYTKWMPADRVGRLEFCEKDGMLMYRIPGTFHIPRDV